MTWILGGHQSDFARNLTREGVGFDGLMAELVAEALADAAVGPADVQTVHVGNAFGQLFTGQGHLGAMPATVEPALWGTPAARHEAACASGSIAVLAAAAELDAGRYDVALVVGAELERTVPGDVAAAHLGAACHVGHEATDAVFVWPAQFSDLADAYDARHGLDDAHLHAIAAKNHRNAKANPLAQTRDWTYPEGAFSSDDTANPVVEGRTRRFDCSQITDGGAAVVLVSDRWLRDNPDRRRTSPDGRTAAASHLAGWGHRTVGLPLAAKLSRADGDPHLLPHLRDTFADALRRSGLGTVGDLDAVETHDCFAMSEYAAIDHLGITAPGDAWKAIESGELERGGRIPVNPSGGLIGGGHPVGATGVRMLLDAHRQVTGTAGGTQVEGAQRVGTLNIGGSTTTTVAFVVESGAAAEGAR